MVKAYLRYEAAGACGVITSNTNANILYDDSGKYLYTPGLENVLLWNIKQGVQVRHAAAAPSGSLARAGGLSRMQSRRWCIQHGSSHAVTASAQAPPGIAAAAAPGRIVAARGAEPLCAAAGNVLLAGRQRPQQQQQRLGSARRGHIDGQGAQRAAAGRGLRGRLGGRPVRPLSPALPAWPDRRAPCCCPRRHTPMALCCLMLTARLLHDPQVRLWNASSGECQVTLKGHKVRPAWRLGDAGAAPRTRHRQRSADRPAPTKAIPPSHA